MRTQKERNEILAAKALHWMILSGDAVPKTYHIPGEEGGEGYDVTIYKVKGNPSPYKPKGRRTR